MPERDQFLSKPDLPLGKYRHYKGGEYEVITLACDESTLEWRVVYRALYDTKGAPEVWTRTYDNFTDTVDANGMKRFTCIGGQRDHVSSQAEI